MKITIIGGGSVQWTPKIALDIALNPILDGCALVLHDVDQEALGLLTKVASRLTAQAGSRVSVQATTNRREALAGADFVILCVSVGGLVAMRGDLEIPQRYGVAQSVGDTTGPGGLARALRHIPFALAVAREMESLCPSAWLLNLTNPMTVVCRAVSRATSIRTLGLCHEVDNVRGRLADLLGVRRNEVQFTVAGINHLPVLIDLRVRGEDGYQVLRAWLEKNSAFAFVDRHVPDVHDSFEDRLAVKLLLFQTLGVLYGAGDRHLAEFFPGFLTCEADRGRRYGVVPTTVEDREQLARSRRANLERVARGGQTSLTHSEEQIAPLMAALLGGPPRTFVVNTPNRGQVANLPLEAVVECQALVDAHGVHPLSTGHLPPVALATVAAHVTRQELIVQAALASNRELALSALALDPLVPSPALAGQLLDALLEVHADYKPTTGEEAN